jgi:hypothetical protein
MMAYLCIGGVADGERRSVPDDEWCVSINYVPPTAVPDLEIGLREKESFEQGEPLQIETHVYRRRMIDHSGLSVFALEGMDWLGIMQALVEHYNPKGE